MKRVTASLASSIAVIAPAGSSIPSMRSAFVRPIMSMAPLALAATPEEAPARPALVRIDLAAREPLVEDRERIDAPACRAEAHDREDRDRDERGPDEDRAESHPAHPAR